jgi:phosphoribosylformimino-5-aminoimidazole carboxamide ribotide isomerase
MVIIPAIDILGGRCVRLYQGDFARETAFAEDPAPVAAHFQELGARRLHVVDLDGARSGHPMNTQVVRRILEAVTIPVQVGGGLRQLASVEEYLNMGVDAVVLGTAAVQTPQLLAKACQRFPEQVMAAIDARDGWAAIAGWQETTDLTAVALAQRLVELGVTRLVYTDILRDGTLGEPNFPAIEEMVASVNAQVIASGGITNLDHLQRLARMGLAGAIVGSALYTKDIDLRQALAMLGSSG